MTEDNLTFFSMIYIGIDTGVHTGFAVWNTDTKEFESLFCTDIHVAMYWVKHWKEFAEDNGVKLFVRVEDPRQRTWFGTERMSREEERKRLQGVGSVKRDASIWDAYLKDLGVSYEMVAPKRNVTKITHDTFASLTGWNKKKRTNEHMRDAAMLVYGYK